MAKILTVDDAATIRGPLKLILEELGHQVFDFENGRVALEFAHQNSVDLVITDLNMPEMDGVTLISHLRNLDNYKSIPILVMTTESSDDKKKEAKSVGASGWLTKPFSRERIKAALNKTIG